VPAANCFRVVPTLAIVARRQLPRSRLLTQIFLGIAVIRTEPVATTPQTATSRPDFRKIAHASLGSRSAEMPTRGAAALSPVLKIIRCVLMGYETLSDPSTVYQKRILTRFDRLARSEPGTITFLSQQSGARLQTRDARGSQSMASRPRLAMELQSAQPGTHSSLPFPSPDMPTLSSTTALGADRQSP
jgi:hypothetical protein